VISRRYEIERFLGTGLLGDTYVARHLSSGKQLAIKILRPNLISNPRDRRRFMDLYNQVKPLKHDGLIRWGEVSEHHGHVYYTQEYFESQNLRQLIDEYLREQKIFPLQEACQIIIKVLEVAEYLHDQGTTHRNLSPANILIHTRRTGPGGQNIVRTIKITDSTMAAMVNPTIFAESYITRDDARYLAPELSGFADEGGPPSDIYAIGVMLYEILVGQTPRGTYLSPTQLRGDLPEHIDDIVENALGTTPGDRYPSARDMINDIQRLFSSEMQHQDTTTNYRTALIAIGALLLIIIGVGVYQSQTEPHDPVADAIAEDERLRREIQAANKMPTEAEIAAMVADNGDMLYIPPGDFLMGRLAQEDLKTASQSEPLTRTIPVEGFLIDRFEYPNILRDTEGNPAHPVARVAWQSAADACAKAEKRLCTEEEWEKACKGPANWIYSYGDTYDEDMCGRGVSDSYTLGSKDSCVSGFGVWGMSGGPREWTSSVAGSKGNRRVVKGGLRGNNERGSRCAFAVDESTNYADSTLAFRCCKSI